MIDFAQLQKDSLRALSTMRRAYAAFNQEMTEFGAAATNQSVEMMDVARRQAHDQLDVYFDAIAATQSISHAAQESTAPK